MTNNFFDYLRWASDPVGGKITHHFLFNTLPGLRKHRLSAKKGAGKHASAPIIISSVEMK
jgi:hypothetical protein